MNHKNTIEINGKVYDTRSGALVTGDHTQTTFHPQPSIDGVVRPQSTAQSTDTPIKHGAKSKAQHNPHKRHGTQKSHTLMRKSVQKPEPTNNPAHTIRTFNRAGHTTNTHKSPYVQRFSAAHAKPILRTEQIDVQSPPEQAPIAHAAKIERVEHSKPAKHEESIEEIFQRAIADAPSKRPKNKKEATRAHKIGRTATFIATFAVLVGFIAYMNFANLQVKLASTQAGFNASMPSYTVAGYNMKRSIDTEPGKVSIAFTSNTDNRGYTVKEEVSKWNSQALQDNFLSAGNIAYQTTQDQGKTIFLYEDGNATWVNGGIWYTIDSDSLSTDQLVNIASSL